jgi:hypothetical protein
MSQASSRPDRGSPESNKKGGILTPSRIVVIVLAVAIAVVFYHEYQVRNAILESREEVHKHLRDEKTQESILQVKDVPKYLHGSWEHSTPQGDVDVYTWKGWINSYEIRVTHDTGGYVQNVQSH